MEVDIEYQHLRKGHLPNGSGHSHIEYQHLRKGHLHDGSAFSVECRVGCQREFGSGCQRKFGSGYWQSIHIVSGGLSNATSFRKQFEKDDATI